MPPLTLSAPVDSLKPHPADDLVTQRRVDLVAGQMREHGQYRAVLVNRRDMTILAGLRTWLAAKALGWDEVAVTYVNVDPDGALRLLRQSKPDDGYDEGDLPAMIETLAGDPPPPLDRQPG